MSVIDIKSIKKVRAYRKKGLGVREIARLLRKDPTQVLRWMKYNVDSNPQLRGKKVLTV